MSYLGPALNLTGPITLNADEEAATHTFGRQAAAVAIMVANTAFDGVAVAEVLDASGTWQQLDSFSSLATAAQGNWTGTSLDFTVPTPQLVSRGGFSQIRVRIESYVSGSLDVSFVDQVAVPGEIRRVTGLNDESVKIRIQGQSSTLHVRPLLSETNSTITSDDPDAGGAAARQNIDNLVFQVTGDLVGTLVPQISLNGDDWVTIDPALITDVSTGTEASGAYAAGGVFLLNFGGAISWFRMLCTAYTSGTANISIRGTSLFSD